MEAVLTGIRYLFTLGFGIALSAAFAGVAHRRNYVTGLVAFFAADLAVQSAIASASSIQLVQMVYPLVTHIPLVFFLVLWCRRTWQVSLGAVFTAYLCCELPNMVEKLTLLASGGSPGASTTAYVVSAVAFYVLLRRFVAGPVNELLEYSRTSCLAFSAVPLVYYVWCYAAGIYTDWIVSNSYEAMLAVSGMFSTLFVIFAAIYSIEVKRRSTTIAAQEKTEMQLQQAGKELESLRRLQSLTAEYRHDTRHRLRVLSALAQEGNIEAIKELVADAANDLDNVSPTRFSANESVNIVLSFYVSECERRDIGLRVNAQVGRELPLSNTEVCALIGNALENAVTACNGISGASIEVELLEHRGNLLLSVTNSYEGIVVIEGGVPQSEREGHGYGCASIKAIAENHRGQAMFSAADGVFSLRVAIPL